MLMVQFIGQHKQEFGVESICTVLQFVPSTYYAAKVRPPSKRSVRDEGTVVKIRDVHASNYGVYGPGKFMPSCDVTGNASLGARPSGSRAVRDCEASLGARGLEPRSLARSPGVRRTSSIGASPRLRPIVSGVRTSPTSARPRAGSTRCSCSTCSSRRIFGWQLSTSLHTDLALDALEMGI